MLHQKYYTEYGLAIEGLVRHHKIDPLEYNKKVDDALPLDGLITSDPNLREVLEDMDKRKVKLWLFTNAHVTHATRVVKLLGIDDLFEGMTFCDYTQSKLVCKPHKEMFDKAELEAGAASVNDCFFVGEFISLPIPISWKDLCGISDDSYLNCRHAHARGWTTVHLLEPEDPEPATKAGKYQVRSLEELRDIFPQFFLSSTTGTLKDSQL